MAKGKSLSVPNKVIHSRVNYLYQAASYLATQQQHSNTSQSDEKGSSEKRSIAGVRSDYAPAASLLASDLKAVSLKAQIRISPAMKQSICKGCNTMLVDGSTCSSEVENKSRGGKKPWADVLVRRCNICGISRRYPTGTRQKRRPHRKAEIAVKEGGATEKTWNECRLSKHDSTISTFRTTKYYPVFLKSSSFQALRWLEVDCWKLTCSLATSKETLNPNGQHASAHSRKVELYWYQSTPWTNEHGEKEQTAL